VRARQTEREDSLDRFLGALGAAVRRHRLYPPGNPLSTEAVDACLVALGDVDTGSVELRVSSNGLEADGESLPDTPVLRDLEDAVFRADLDTVRIPAGVAAGELARFARLLARWAREPHEDETFADALAELGVTGVQVLAVERARFIPTPVLDRGALAALERERALRPDTDEEAGLTLQRAWVRADTDTSPGTLDLVDLAFLCEDPLELAGVLERMSEGSRGELDRARVLVDRVGELIRLYHRLSPEHARRRLRDLGDAILALDAPTRRSLVAGRLLPELLDTGLSAPLLRRLPDGELATALAGLARRAVGSAGIVELALARLELPQARATDVRDALASVVEGAGAGLDRRDPAMGRAAGSIGHSDMGEVEQGLREYTALDLAVTEEVLDELDRIRERAPETDQGAVRLRCLTSLVPLARNPDRIAEIVGAAGPSIGRLLREEPAATADRVSEWIGLADSSRETRPEVTASIEAMLGGLLTPEVLREAASPREGDDAPGAAVAAFAHLAGAALLDALETEPDRATRRALLDYACRVGGSIADGVAPRSSDPRWTVQRNVARILGFAGSAHESSLCFLLRSREPRVTREALLGLARIGSRGAADAVVQALYDPDPGVAAMAEESIRRFPHAEARRRARALLSDPVFYTRRPRLARDLLRRFLAGDPERSAVLGHLARLRFRVWRPAVATLGWAAWSAARRRAA